MSLLCFYTNFKVPCISQFSYDVALSFCGPLEILSFPVTHDFNTSEMFINHLVPSHEFFQPLRCSSIIMKMQEHDASMTYYFPDSRQSFSHGIAQDSLWLPGFPFFRVHIIP